MRQNAKNKGFYDFAAIFRPQRTLSRP